MKLTLVVGAHNHLEIKNLLDSIDEDIEIIVVLNDPTNALLELINNYKKRKLKIIKIKPKSLGLIKCLGIKKAKNNKIVFADADCILEKGALKKFDKYLEVFPVCKGKIVLPEKKYFDKIISRARYTQRAFSPALGINKNIAPFVCNDIFCKELPWREDYYFDKMLSKNKIPIKHCPDIIFHHPPVPLYHDLRTAFRCGGGQRIIMEKCKLKSDYAYGGARGLFHSIFVDFVRILLLPYVFVYEAIKIGPVSSLYKIIWKIIFTIGYYYQMFFKFLGKYE